MVGPLDDSSKSQKVQHVTSILSSFTKAGHMTFTARGSEGPGVFQCWCFGSPWKTPPIDLLLRTHA